MTFKRFHGGSSVVLDLSKDSVVLLKERRRLKLDNKGSGGSEGFNHSIVISNGFLESSDGLNVNFVSFV